MRIRISIEPNTAPLYPEQIAALPIKPDETFRSQVVYVSEEMDANDNEKRSAFFGLFEKLKKNFEAAFGCPFESYVYFDGDGTIYLSKWELQDLANINACVEVQ